MFSVREWVQCEGVPTVGGSACSCEEVRESVREWVPYEGMPRVRGSVSLLSCLFPNVSCLFGIILARISAASV